MPSTKRLPIGGAIAAGLLVGACGDPDLNTDLITAGPPEVTIVNVASESNATEMSVFCKDDVDEVHRNVHYCERDDGGDIVPIGGGAVADAPPIGFTVRFVFDELLDPSIETLLDAEGNETTNAEDAVSGTIAPADPFTVTCGTEELAYDGFYDPTGSHLSFSPGPALVLISTDTVATGSDCEVELNSGTVADKDGEEVPSAQLGPFEFTIAPLAVALTDPEDMAEGVDADALNEVDAKDPTVGGITIVLNNDIDDASLAGRVTVAGGTGAFTVENLGGGLLKVRGTFEAETAYTVTVAAGVADVKGGTLAADAMFGFETGPAM